MKLSTGQINEPKLFKFGDAPSRARRITKRNDILLSTVRPYLKAISKVNLDDNNLVCSTGFSGLRLDNYLCNYSFLYQVVISDEFINQLMVKMVGSNYPAVNSNDLANSVIPYPHLSEQEQIAISLSNIDARIDLFKKEHQDFIQLKKGLMEKLLTGKIRTTELQMVW